MVDTNTNTDANTDTDANFIIPTKLCITINTNISNRPIKYLPENTLKNSKDAIGPLFNPLVQLQNKIIDKEPANVSQSQYFYLSQFNALMDLHELAEQPMVPPATIINPLRSALRLEPYNPPSKQKLFNDATYKGFIDNNILIMLEKLFPIGGKFYNNKTTYSILSMLWTKGDWEITYKNTNNPPFFSSNNTPFSKYNITTFNPYHLYTREYLNAAIRNMPVNLRQGINYKPPPPPPTSNAPIPNAPPMPTPPNPHTQAVKELNEQIKNAKNIDRTYKKKYDTNRRTLKNATNKANDIKNARRAYDIRNTTPILPNAFKSQPPPPSPSRPEDSPNLPNYTPPSRPEDSPNLPNYTPPSRPEDSPNLPNYTPPPPPPPSMPPPPSPTFDEEGNEYFDAQSNADEDVDSADEDADNSDFNAQPITPDQFNRNKNTVVGGAKRRDVLDDYFRKRLLEDWYKKQNKLKKVKKEYVDVCYHITIDLELYRGESLTPNQLDELKCKNKWNAVRKAYAEFTNQRYIIPPYQSVTAKPVTTPIAKPVTTPIAKPVYMPVAKPIAKPIAAAAVPMVPLQKTVRKGGRHHNSVAHTIKNLIHKYG